MSAYLIIQAVVSDWGKFKKYTDIVPSIMKKYGGEYIVMDSSPEVFEGNEPGSVVVSKWASKEAAYDFWQSQAYQNAIPLREGTGTFHVMLVNSL